jgi:acetamidase/formamidase
VLNLASADLTVPSSGLSSAAAHVKRDKHLSRDDALMLCSAAMDLRITQLVDGTKGAVA